MNNGQPGSASTQVATLGGGCFWCIEAIYNDLQGVTSAISGYAGGHVKNPTYQQVCNHTTGHAEVVQVKFDPNVITYRGRSAAREIGKALNFSPSIIDRFSHLFASGDFPHTMELEAQIEAAGLPKHHPRMPAFIRLYHAIYGLPRHLGQHSGGMIICQNKLSSFVPLENASMPGRVVAQWDKDDCEDLGIVKVDLLGLGMMSVMLDAF